MFTFLLYLLLPFCLGIPNLPGHSFDYKQLNNGKVKIKFNGTHCKRLHFLKDSLDIVYIFWVYIFLRTEYTSNITNKQEKILFLSSIKTWREFQGSLYHIRRDYIPALPEFQDELNVESDFFKDNNLRCHLNNIL